MSEVSIQKLKSIVAKVRAPNTVDGGEDSSSDAATVAAEFEDSIPIDFRSKRRNTKVNDQSTHIFHAFKICAGLTMHLFRVTGSGHV